MRSLAEVDIHHSRPIAPTRRVSLGPGAVLPIDPAPGPGGILLGGIVASFRDGVDDELLDDVLRLTLQLQEDVRVVQPRLRHRFQSDRHGLTRSTYRLVETPDGLDFRFDHKASPLQAVIGAVYAAGSLPAGPRRLVMDAVRSGLRWAGPADRTLIAHLSGIHHGRPWSADDYRDPMQWALGVFGLRATHNGSVHLPERSAILDRFRVLLREAHPDHGGSVDDAAQRIGDLTEARRILLS